ncbi:branched-chain amino acid ABC transporter ATP-binding protein/permease [Aquincola sp. MAHUQ-54]|uniref:Branched-chain amino acid ABC transporter ATP-binding protein/permease n=1 Tax=Aquincola agrisoli TaxID=3119538 RepID=A0AAW9QDT4_9BURK
MDAKLRTHPSGPAAGPSPQAAKPALTREHKTLLALAIGLVLLPQVLLAGGLTVTSAVDCVVLAIVGLGLNVLLGHAGLVSFGHGAWFGIGAYAVAILQLRWFPEQVLLPIAGMLVLLVAGSAAVGALVLRRRGVYFSLLTLAFSALCFAVAYRWTALTGGENGLGGIQRGTLFGVALDTPAAFYTLVAVIGFLVAAALLRLTESPFGKVLLAIRENETRAAFLGYPVRRYKLLAFIVSSTVTGLAGGLFVLNHRIASAESLSVTFSGELLAIVLIGGMRSYAGPIIGALFYLLFREYLSMLTENWLLYFGLVFIGFILFSPSGLVGVGTRLWRMVVPEKTTEAAMSARSTPPTVGEFPAFLPHSRGESVKARGITKSFGGVKAVAGVTVTVADRGVHALIGPNGAGKTSFFNLLSGMFAPSAGTVAFAGRQLEGASPDRVCSAGIARSFQITNLFKGLSVRDNLVLSVMARSSARTSPWRRVDALPDVQRETDELTRFLGITGMEHATAEDLSYGGQRLVDMGLALGSAPRVLLLDEPLAGLAVAERDRIGRLIRALGDRIGVLLVEHDVDRVFAISDHITVMNQGQVLVEGNSARVQADERVREIYIGSGTEALAQKVPASQVAEAVSLKVQGIEAFYGKSHILSGIGFEAHEGEIMAVLGRNGAGKSTLLKSLIGLARLGDGEVHIAGQAVRTPVPETMARLGIAFVPQGRRLFPGLTVRDNLMLGRLRRSGPEADAWSDERIFEVFPRLRERYEVNAELLSGGEQQMVAIARALAGHVRVLLLDEPFEGLSPAMTEEVFNAVLRLKGKVTILIVDHNLDLTLALSDTALVLDRGRVSHFGPALPLLKDLAFRREKLWV